MTLLTSLLAATLTCSTAEATPAPAVVADSTRRDLFEKGISFGDFLTKARQRKEQWERNYAQGAVPDALLARARGVGGTWKVLAVAVDGCSDSVNTIPYLARLAEHVVGMELRIVGSDVGRVVMEGHRTADGRAATPTVLLLDGEYLEAGCFIERPAELRRWMEGEKGKRGDDQLFSGKMVWYDENKGVATVSDFVEMLEAAARGGRLCPPS